MSRRMLPLLACVAVRIGAVGIVALGIGAVGLGLTGCGGEPASAGHQDGAAEATTPAQATPSQATPAEAAREPGVVHDEHGEPAGLRRHRRWSEKVGQGAQPVGDVAFANLAALGYRAVLSVDGMVPDVEGAARHGLRYLHVPIGYDGVDEEQALAIARSGMVEGPVYVHCHHGKHRGPTAAMILRLSHDGISNEEAVKGLTISRTSKHYRGLWRDVRAYRAPEAEVIAAAPVPPSKVVPEGLRAGMVGVSHRFEMLKLSRKVGWKVPPGHPDVSPPHEARMLWELYRELARTDAECRAEGAEFLALLHEGEKAATDLEKSLRAEDRPGVEKAYAAVAANCTACHDQFRD